MEKQQLVSKNTTFACFKFSAKAFTKRTTVLQLLQLKKLV